MKRVIAVDLGASSGRVICITKDNGKIYLEEVHRFLNEGIYAGERLYTDILYIYNEILKGIKLAYRKYDVIDSMGIDSWGVDFALLDVNGELITNPYHYRDTQNICMIEKAEKIFGRHGLFQMTGVQDMWYNSVYQLLGMQNRKMAGLKYAEKMLMIPDLLGYFLSGNKTTEYTSASTTQLYDLQKKCWSEHIIYELGLPRTILPEVIMTGQEKGQLTEKNKKLIGIPKNKNLKLIATAGHDSAAAAYAVPSDEKRYIFINSGTWSIIGMITDQPVITEEIRQKGYSNEGAAFGKIKIVRSIMGMWLIQELRKCWEKQGKETDYKFLIEQTNKVAPFSHFIDVEDELFVAPLDMEDVLNQYCERTHQTPMTLQGEFYRAVQESLAFKYREAIMDLEMIMGYKMDTVFLLGGAVQDHNFCQFIANATGKRVSAGPIEATAIGNAMIQLRALEKEENNENISEMLKNSFDIKIYEPEECERWNDMYKLYRKITKVGK